MIKFFNTLGHKLENFDVPKGKTINMYVCGPTVYDFDHLGHARTFIVFDSIRRFLTEEGYKVKYLQNITDVGHLVGDSDTGEDKISRKAKKEQKDPFEIARFYEKAHFADMEGLNIQKPSLAPRATEHIQDFIEYIKKLVEAGFAYEFEGDIYFDITKFPQYGKLSGKNPDELKAGARVAPEKGKRHPADFALLKKADPEHLMQWESPWGKGYPGWHIECSVMSQKYLGETLDIHGGAVELGFQHHENEIAQSESLTHKPLARFWLHSGLVTINGEKMAKSLGNFVTIRDLLDKYSADTIRLAILKTHWRRPLDWAQNTFEEASVLARRMTIYRLKAPDMKTGFIEEIMASLEDDFNTPKALGFILENMEKLSVEDWAYIQRVFGLKLEEEKLEISAENKELIEKREQLRREKKFAEADEIRRKLVEKGINVEDSSLK